MDLDLRRLRYFLAVVEELSFTSAAARLHLAQPALSRQIQALEADLGVRLFDRNRRGTSLTPVGEHFAKEARALLSQADAAIRRTRIAVRGPVAFTIGFMPGIPTTAVIGAFVAAHPGLDVEAIYVAMDEQEPWLLDGRVDVSFVRLPLNDSSLASVPLYEEPRVALLPADAMPDADSPVSLDTLTALPLIDPENRVAGWTGQRRDPARGNRIEDRLEAVAAGAVTVLPAGIAHHYQRDDLRALALIDVAPVTVALAYVRDRPLPNLDDFVALVVGHLGPWLLERLATGPAGLI